MVIEYLTGILVLVTAIYAYLTHKLAQSSAAAVAAMEQQNWEASRAFIVASPFVRSHTPFLYLRIRNNGRSSALNLTMQIDKDFFQFAETSKSDHNLRNKNAFNQVIDAFHPGQELVFALAQGWKIFGDKPRPEVCPAKFTITATYDCLGKRVTESNPIDLTAFLGSEGERDPIVEELERMRKTVEKRCFEV